MTTTPPTPIPPTRTTPGRTAPTSTAPTRTAAGATRPALPDFARLDARAVHLRRQWVPGAPQARATLDRIMTAWRQTAWPEGLLSLSAYLSVDRDTVLTYAQGTDDDVYPAFVRSLPGTTAPAPIGYRLHRSLVLDDAAGPPGVVVTASFDVDGPERQRHIIESVADRMRLAPVDEHEGLIASHFHASHDGTRVVNVATWTTDAAHVAFLDGATRRGNVRAAQATPGVRLIGFTRFHLHRSLGR